MDPDLGVDPDPPWIRIHMIPIPALLDVIPAPDPDPQKSGVVTPLEDIIGLMMVALLGGLKNNDPNLGINGILR